MAVTPSLHLKRPLLLLHLLVLLAGSCSSSSAERESIASFTSAVDEISLALSERGQSCFKTDLPQDLEKRVSMIEEILESNSKTIEDIQVQVENVSRVTSDLLDHHYSISPTSAPGECDEPFKMAAGSCFWAHKNPSQSWDAARRRCQQAGSDLATPDDIPGVISFLKKELGLDWWYVWMGGKITSQTSRTWKWLDTDITAQADYEHWFSVSNPGRCTAFNGGRGFKIMGWDCDSSCWFLCEKKIASR